MKTARREFLKQSSSAVGLATTGLAGCAQGVTPDPAGVSVHESQSTGMLAAAPATAAPAAAASASGSTPIEEANTTLPPLLQPSDIAYLGSYKVELNGTNQVYDRGLTVRRVGTEPRFLVHSFAAGNTGPFREFSVSGLSYGDTVRTTTGQWSSTGLTIDMGNHPHEFIWWDEAGQRLWVTAAGDYPSSDAPTPTNVNVMQLGTSSIQSLKKVSLQGVPDRRAKGPLLAIPATAQSRWGYGPYAIGFGGYASRMTVGGQCAMGLSVFAMPDPAPYPNNSTIPASALKTMATRGVTPRGKRIWYGYNWSTMSGKGPVNYMDGGDPRMVSNPSFPPTAPPNAAAQWQSPGADGLANWPGMGSTYCGGFYIDGPTKRGVVVVGTFHTGRVYYMNSAVYSDGQTAEVHIFDPEHLGAVSRGTRSADSVEPVSMRACPETDIQTGNAPHFAAYDPIGKRLYIYHGDWIQPSRSTLHVYSVTA